VRCCVGYLRDDENFRKMTGIKLERSDSSISTIATTKQQEAATMQGLLDQKVHEELKKYVKGNIVVSSSLWQCICNLREKINNNENFLVSDRRWNKILYFIRLASWARKYTSLQLDDSYLMLTCLWRDLEELEELQVIWLEEFVAFAEKCDKMKVFASIKGNFWLTSEDKKILEDFVRDPKNFAKLARESFWQTRVERQSVQQRQLLTPTLNKSTQARWSAYSAVQVAAQK